MKTDVKALERRLRALTAAVWRLPLKQVSVQRTRGDDARFYAAAYDDFGNVVLRSDKTPYVEGLKDLIDTAEQQLLRRIREDVAAAGRLGLLGRDR